MLKEQIEKKIEYLKSLNTTDERVAAKLEELQWILQMIEVKLKCYRNKIYLPQLF